MRAPARGRRLAPSHLVGLGIREYEAKQYEGKIRDGNILISVHTEDGDERRRAKEILELHQVKDVSSTREKRAS